MMESDRGGIYDARRYPSVGAEIIFPACIKIPAAEFPAPNDHFAPSVHCGLRVSRRRRIVQACGNPTVRAQVVSAAGVRVVERFIDAAPDDHYTAGPQRAVAKSCGRRVRSAGGCPGICLWIVSGAGVKLGGVVRSAPHDHLAAAPDCCMKDSY